MIKVKALAVMTRPELEQALADVNVTRRLQHKLLELQQERIAELREALSGLLSYAEVAEDASLVGHEGCHWPVEIAREALAATEPRP